MSISPKRLRLLTWGVRILLAAAFAAAAIAKFNGVPMMVQTFEQIGAGQWFRYLTAAVELLGAVLLLVPRAALLGGMLLGSMMLAAIATHLFVIGGSPVPALVLGALCAFVAYRLRPAIGASSMLAAVRS